MPALKTNVTLTVDVYEDQPADLRQRLRGRREASVASLLPGGVVLNETEAGVTYSLVAQGWRASADGGELAFESPEGHVLRLDGGRLSLTLAR